MIWARQAQFLFDYINDRLPERCRKRLVSRMSEEEIAAAEERARTKLAERDRRRLASKRGRGP